MVQSALPAFSVLCSLAVLSSTTEAHQVVLLPKPYYVSRVKELKVNAMDPLAFLESQNITTGPSFQKWRMENSYKTLDDKTRYDVVNNADFFCGWTDRNGAPLPIPKNGAMRTSLYTHDGPCEVWLDNKRVAQGDNCHSKFPGKDHCIDYSSCDGKCTLYWFWLAERFIKNKHSWQVYKACVPLTTGGAPVQPANCTARSAINASPKW